MTKYPFVSICDPDNSCYEDCERVRLDQLQRLTEHQEGLRAVHIDPYGHATTSSGGNTTIMNYRCNCSACAERSRHREALREIANAADIPAFMGLQHAHTCSECGRPYDDALEGRSAH